VTFDKGRGAAKLRAYVGGEVAGRHGTGEEKRDARRGRRAELVGKEEDQEKTGGGGPVE